jgi:hypothetical protein
MDAQDAEIINKIPVDIDELIDDPELIVVDRSVLEEEAFKNQAVELYNMVRTDPVLAQISRVYLATLRNLAVAYKTIDSDLIVPTEEELQEALTRHAQQQSLADMQKEIAKGQFQAQLAQIQAATQQQAIASKERIAQGQQGAQVQIAADKNAAALEQQAREQDLAAVQGVLQPEQPTQPAA